MLRVLSVARFSRQVRAIAEAMDRVAAARVACGAALATFQGAAQNVARAAGQLNPVLFALSVAGGAALVLRVASLL